MYKRGLWCTILLTVVMTPVAIAKCVDYATENWHIYLVSVEQIEGAPVSAEEEARQEALWPAEGELYIMDYGTKDYDAYFLWPY